MVKNTKTSKSGNSPKQTASGTKSKKTTTTKNCK